MDRNIAESQASDMASVSATRDERATRRNLVEFHERGITLLYLSFKKMIYPPCPPPSGRLLKLASAKTVIEKDFKPSFGMLMELGVLLTNLITLFMDRISATVAFFTLVLTWHTSKLISGLVIPANHLSFPREALNDVVSSFVRLRCGLSLCSLLLGMCSMVSV